MQHQLVLNVKLLKPENHVVYFPHTWLTISYWINYLSMKMKFVLDDDYVMILHYFTYLVSFLTYRHLGSFRCNSFLIADNLARQYVSKRERKDKHTEIVWIIKIELDSCFKQKHKQTIIHIFSIIICHWNTIFWFTPCLLISYW